MKVDVSNIEFSKSDIKRNIKLPKVISKDLAYLCGVLAGDGHLSANYGNKYRNLIYCSGNPKDEIEFYNKIISPLFYKLFNIKLKPKHYSDGTYGIKVESKGIMEYFTKIIGFTRGSKYKTLKIPILFRINNNLLKYFIRGVADTDFSFTFKKRYNVPCIVGASKSLYFSKELINKLNIVGFNFRLYKITQVDPRFKKPATVYRFETSGKNKFLLWIKKIGSNHPKNLKKYNWYIQNIK